MEIDPPSQGQIRIQEQQQNLKAGCSQAVEAGRSLMEADANAARDGVDAQGIDGGAVGSADRVAHGVRCG